MSEKSKHLKPQDVLILLRIIASGPIYSRHWDTVLISRALNISQSEVSESVRRSKYIGFMDMGKSIFYQSFIDFLVHGLRFVFPARPGAITRGVPTAHSAFPLKKLITQTEQIYVWPYAFGNVKGESIEPLYHTLPKVIFESDFDKYPIEKRFYELAALTDALRVGKARERNIAKTELEKRIITDNWD